MQDKILSVRSASEAPVGQFWELTGTVVSAGDVAVTLPVLCRRMLIKNDGTVIAEDAFTIAVVQAKARVILVAVRQPLGDVEFDCKDLKFGLRPMESATMMSRSEAEVAVETMANGPWGVVNEELTLATMAAVHARLEECTSDEATKG